MSFHSRINFAALFMVAALAVLTGGGAAGSPLPLDRIAEQVRAAILDDNYDKVFDLLLPWAEQGNPGVEFGFCNILTIMSGRSAVLGKNEPDAILRKRDREGMGWGRAAARHGSRDAMDYLASAYKAGWHHVPVDQELSRCYAAAEQASREKKDYRPKIAECREMEVRKGYWPE